MSPVVERLPYPVGRLRDGRSRAIVFDSAKCIGCRQCVEACKDWNELPRGNTYAIGASTWLTIEPPVIEGKATVWGRNSCMHCRYPLCAAVCPVEAITRYDEGPVVIDQAACIGCGLCVEACPWNVIAKDEVANKARKCTMCHDRFAEDAAPFCVQSCPVSALDFGLQEELETRAARRAVELGAALYGQREAGGTQLLHILAATPQEHGLRAVVGAERFPEHRIPLRTTLKALFSLTGGIEGKLRAAKNAFSKPWRLRYRYWHRPVRAAGANSGPAQD